MAFLDAHQRVGSGCLDACAELACDAEAVVWPELRVRRVLQRYARLAEDRYRYTQGDFQAELHVDEQGLVLEYEGLWKAVALA